MRNLFLLILAGLVVFSQMLVTRGHGTAAAGPAVVYWVTDPNPARQEQISLFREWLKNRHEADVEVRVDAVNSGGNKVVVQGVSGIAGDMMDLGGAAIHRFQPMGILQDLGPVFAAAGLPAIGTFPALADELTVDGRVWATPCNVWVQLFIVNNAAFSSVGMAPPPARWTFETFERLGKEFTTKANAGRKRREVFFASKIDGVTLARSIGIPKYNETLTLPWADTNAIASLNRMIYKWTYVDHLVPSDAEKASLSVEQGYGESEFQLMHRGYYAMVYSGRHALIQLRKMQPAIPLTAVESPHGGFPNVFISARSLAMYAGGRNQAKAGRFFAFLRSEEYSMHLVRDADGMPPNLDVLDRPEMLSPAGHTNEWDLHRAFVKLTRDAAIAQEISPFHVGGNLRMKAMQAYMSGVGTAEGAAHDVYDGTVEEIEKYTGRTPERKRAYLAALAVQKKIDALKARGEKIPIDWIANPFLRAYYQAKGMTTAAVAGR